MLTTTVKVDHWPWIIKITSSYQLLQHWYMQCKVCFIYRSVSTWVKVPTGSLSASRHGTTSMATSLTLLDLPLDIISAMPLAASFFSATQRTRLIWARFRIISASCVASGHRTLSTEQKRRWVTTKRCATSDRRANFPMRCSSMPISSHKRSLLPVSKSLNCLSMLAGPTS